MNPSYDDGDTRYAYAVGRIRTLEARLLDGQRVERLVEAKDFEETFSILRETDYGEEFGEERVASLQEIEQVLQIKREGAYRTFTELCLDEEVRELILSTQDYQNIKVLIKASVTGEDPDFALSRFGILSGEKIKRIFKEGRSQGFSTHLQKAVEAGLSYDTPEWIDIAVDHEMFRFWSARAKEVGNDFILGFIQLILDLENIQTFFRIRRGEGGLSFLEKALFFNGWGEDTMSLHRDRFLKAFESPWEGISSYFFATPYERVLREGGEYLERKGSFASLEKLCDDCRMEYLRSTRRMTFGVEPVIAYLFAKENELKILRLIFLGKLYGITQERIRERLPEVF